VDVTPRGEITRYKHLIDENAPGADLTREQAQSMAEAFLQQDLHQDLSKLEFTEVTTEKRPRRTDHSFIWKSREFAPADSQYRFSVRIQGSEVGEYDEYLKIPDEWLRSYQKLRSLNETTATVDFILLFSTLLAMLVVLVLYIRQRDIRWRLAGYFGLMAFVLTFLSQLNSFPLKEFGFKTTDTYGSFWTGLLLNALVASAASGAAIFLLTASAEPLYRHNYANRVSLSNLFRWQGLRSKEFFLGSLIGLTLTFFFFAYDSLFYLIAQKLGAWAPADVPYSDLLNTNIPWAFVLFFGFFPAVSEEFVSRMFSVPFFERLFRYRWLAVGLASFIWGFGHANYPNQPFYIRGIEVGVGGLIVSYVFLKFGIVGPMVWHYSVDALYTAFLLLRSKNQYLMISGGLSAGIMLIPFLLALFAYLRSKGFLTVENITNASEKRIVAAPELPSVTAAEETDIPYIPLSGIRRGILIGVSILLLVPQTFEVRRFGDFIDFAITRSQANRIAEHFLQNKGIDWRSFRTVTYMELALDPIATQYLLKYSNVPVMNQVYSQKGKVYFWVVRFYRPLEEEEYRIDIDPHEKVVASFRHMISENAPGASLERATAQQIAEKFLLENEISLNQFDLKEVNSEKKKSRQDYNFVWESKTDRINEARLRIRLQLQGEQISYYSAFIKIPEEWQRERERNTLADTLLAGTRLFLIAAIAGWAIWTFLRMARQGLIHWRPVLSLSFGLIILQLLSHLNAVPVLFRNYPTSLSPNVFIVSSVSNTLISQIIQFLSVVLLVGLASSLYPDCWSTFRKRNRIRFSADALLLALTVLVAIAGLSKVSGIMTDRFHQIALVPAFPILEEIDHFVPALTSLSRSLYTCVVYTSILALVLYILQNVLKKSYSRIFLLLLILVGLLPGEASTLGELGFALATRSILLVLVLTLIHFFLRGNFLSYLSLLLFVSLFQAAHGLWSQSASFFKWNGAALLFVGAVLILKLVHDALYHARPRFEVQRPDSS
jgi:membrane protease YdiL (CAAX protease family)